LDGLLADVTRCPRCRGLLVRGETSRCADDTCAYATLGFPAIGGTPVLIDFARSIVDRDQLLGQAGASPLSRSRGLLRRLREWAAGANAEAAGNCALFLEACRAVPEPRVLVVGGGSRGSGTEALYAARDIRLVGTDVYASPDVDLIADGHRLPFADASMRGVWIQAVLEHVVAPEEVVAEIVRVLAPGGIVYAETPFLQPVHERAYDFTRFTRSGHRWLFRHFTELRSGTIGGPAESLLWAIRYLARSLFRSDKAGSAFAIAFFWLRYLDRLVDERHRADAATGVYFLGRKSETAIAPRDLVAYFPGVRGG
jgi:SAM-dependent methyltransferase